MPYVSPLSLLDKSDGGRTGSSHGSDQYNTVETPKKARKEPSNFESMVEAITELDLCS